MILAAVGGLTSLEFMHPRETRARTACAPRPHAPLNVPLPTISFSLKCFYCCRNVILPDVIYKNKIVSLYNIHYTY